MVVGKSEFHMKPLTDSHGVGRLYDDDDFVPLVSLKTRDSSVDNSSCNRRFGILNSDSHVHDPTNPPHHLE